VVPDRLLPDAEADRRWRARFSAPKMSLPDWADNAPQRCLYVSNSSGTWELYSWDRDSDTHRQVTDRPNGTHRGTVSPDGTEIWWFADTDGDEFGAWVREPFHGRADGIEPEPAVRGSSPGYPAGLALRDGLVAVGSSTDDGTTIWTATPGQAAQVIYRSTDDAGVGALSKDESLLVISHSEHGDSRHPALRALRVVDGAAVGERWDGPGQGLDILDFSPVRGDNRVLVAHERRGREELLIWDIDADIETELVLDLPGEITADWYPDASALLVLHTFQARTTLHRYHLGTGDLSTLGTAPGTVGTATVRPDAAVEYSWSSAEHPSAIRVLRDGIDAVLLKPDGPAAPGSEPVIDVFVDTPGGRAHTLVARPPGTEGPVPTVFSLHGGPHSADEDRFSPYRAAWLDAGFAVVHVNYRGSTGYGSAWRDAIEGRPGLTELEDVAAAHDWAVHSGLADPDRCVVEGASWGGYLCLLALGTQPERWAAGIAGVPVADYLTAYEDEMEPLRAFDRALFGGSPEQVPDRYRDCSPLTYVDDVRAPVLVVAGENDPRCPIRQIDNYLDRLAEREVRYEVYRYDAGHGSLVTAETVRQASIEIHFARRAVPS
jgi:dienelactone hydrolase